MTDARRWIPQVVNLPKTTTILALGFLAGNLLLLPVLAWLGRYVPEAYRGGVLQVVSLFKDGMLLILGFYFGNRASAPVRAELDVGGIDLEAGYRERAGSRATRDGSTSSQ